MFRVENLIAIIFTVNAMCPTVSGASYLRLGDDHTINECEKFEVCNIVHRPYWGKNAVEKLCNCPAGTFCPATFSDTDRASLLINRRSQMKFCSPVVKLLDELPPCEDENSVAIQVKSTFNNSILSDVSATLMCACEKHPVYWKYHSREGGNFTESQKAYAILDNYACSDLRRCETNEFCGFARTDYGFIFQRCTCSTHDDCRFYVEEEDIEDNIEELFYNELLYRAHCLRNESYEEW